MTLWIIGGLTFFSCAGIFAMGFGVGNSIAKQNVDYELGQAYLLGRRDERNDQRREPV